MYSNNKSLTFGQYVSNDKVLNRKVPENPRFKHVKAAIDTGKNVKRHIDELKEKQKNFNYKKDEVFNRVKFSAFIKLAINVAKDHLKQEHTRDFSPRDGVNASEAGKEDKCKIANVLMGIGEIDLRNEKKRTPAQPPKIEKRPPYLLLDVRDRDDFLQCHIKTAKHYPSAILSRTAGYELDEMKAYKNKQLDLIIVYDDDESIASRVATTLVQRGYENVYLLSGGLKLGYDVFPRSLMASITTGYAPTFKTASVQVRTSTEHFSQEDIDYITQYIEDYPAKGNPTLSSKSCTSHTRSDKSSRKSHLQPCEHLHKPGSVRTTSTCTSRSSHLDQVRFRVASSRCPSDCRTAKVPLKKAPWK